MANKIVLVGCGKVGMSFIYTLINETIIDEICLVSTNLEKANGEVKDIEDALSINNTHIKIYAGDYSECKDAKIIVVTAGAMIKDVKSRLDYASANAKIMIEVGKKIKASGFNGIIVVASNPCDLMTYTLQQVTELPTNKVIGSGTCLDTMRLTKILEKQLNISSEGINAYVLGEHGDSSVIPWEAASIGGEKLVSILNNDYTKMEAIYEEVKNRGYDIAMAKKATYYGIGMCLRRIVVAILKDERAVLVVSAFLSGEYNQSNIYTGVPVVLGKDGVSRILKIALTQEEQDKFNKSCNELKAVYNESIKELLN